MKQPLRIDTTEKPHPEDIEFILQQLLAFNRDRAGEGNFQQLAIFLRNEGARLAGGLIGSTYWQWLYIDILWIDETWRGQGYGHALLEAAEQEAVRRGCKYAYLDTFSFQAPEFYQQQGYVIFGELPNFPPGYSRFFLKKEIHL
ncbi:MAG: Acetyltransferase [Chroococcidiopsis sp. SAG 2025]|uniref:GNAT family N-acetyltransferase n=1 Tax=Chroococcidiopsis sp. SAG 2025 TaxID=171389 RepID=UPI002936E065|nr:GNAT family N-acetyltransferase [Chroococcidiopsis sp. SAG 2025]MDV2991106.1 Acetyltransferase [Chroococcidiopsis sp. SAG 2025]